MPALRCPQSYVYRMLKKTYNSQWLKEFYYRITPGVPIFIIAGMLAIALLTVSSQAIKAALTNPVKSIKADRPLFFSYSALRKFILSTPL